MDRRLLCLHSHVISCEPVIEQTLCRRCWDICKPALSPPAPQPVLLAWVSMPSTEQNAKLHQEDIPDIIWYCRRSNFTAFFTCLLSSFTLERRKVFIKIIWNIISICGCRRRCITHFWSLLHYSVSSTAWHTATVRAWPVHAEEILLFPECCIQAVWGKYCIWEEGCFSWILMELPECMRVWTWWWSRKRNTHWMQCHFKVFLKLWLNFYSGWWLTEKHHVKAFEAVHQVQMPQCCLALRILDISNAILPYGVQIQLSFHLGSSGSVHTHCAKAYMFKWSQSYCFLLGLLREMLPCCRSLVQQDFIPRPCSSFTLSPSFFLIVPFTPL